MINKADDFSNTELCMAESVNVGTISTPTSTPELRTLRFTASFGSSLVANNASVGGNEILKYIDLISVKNTESSQAGEHLDTQDELIELQQCKESPKGKPEKKFKVPP